MWQTSYGGARNGCITGTFPSSAVVQMGFVGFEVFTAVIMKNAVFWDVVPCRSCMNRHFGGVYHLHLQGRKITSEEPA
jgi:hypothetical protein